MSFFDELDQFSDRVAAIDSGGASYTYADLIERSDRFAARLDNSRKRLIFILCGNNVDTLTGYLGTIRSGHTGILLAANIDPELLDNLLELYRPDYIWRPNANGYELVDRNIDRQVSIYRNLSLMLSTSGSTGSPKMVRLTSGNLEANAASIAEYLELDKSERAITSLPMNYSYGLSVVNSHLKVGATLLLTDASVITRPFWDTFRQREATSFAGVPYTYEMLRRIRFFSMSLPSLRTMTQAGGKLTPKFAKEFADFAAERGIRFYIMYGQTEATARISYLPPDRVVEKYKSIGIAIPRGKLRLINTDGSEITAPDTDGELVYNGPNVMLGYAESEADLPKGDELRAELRTGDIARFDSEGFFYITGRMKRFVKIFGNRVNLDEIEHYLKTHGYNAVCGGRDDLLCIATTDHEKTVEIKTVVTAKYGFHHTAVRVAEVDQILKSESGKIQYERIFEGMMA